MMMRSEKGVSAVEFALIAPLLFVLTFGIIEFACLLFDKAVVTNASREGARAAIVYNTNGSTYTPLTVSDVKKVVTDYANGYLIDLGKAGGKNLADTDIKIGYGPEPENIPSEGGTPESGGYVRVQATYTYDFLVLPDLTQLLGGTFTGTIDLVGTTVMRME